MRIAILAAMQEEINDINTLGHFIKKETVGNREFFHNQINHIEYITAITQIGKVAAAHTTSLVISQYKPQYIIVIGTAGALHPELNIGDVVISEKLFQHDVDLRPFRPRFELGLSGKTFFHADHSLIQLVTKSAKAFIQHADFQAKQNILSAFNITKPKITQGLITSGDSFFSSSSHAYRKEIQDLMPHTLAIEMEGAAIAQVCEDLNIPFVVIRFISDKADHSASIDHSQFTSQIAAWYGKNIIEYLFNNLTK